MAPVESGEAARALRNAAWRLDGVEGAMQPDEVVEWLCHLADVADGLPCVCHPCGLDLPRA